MLKADKITKSYLQFDKPLHVLKGISLDIHQGEIVAIVGPSGAGKSTLLHILGGLDKPDQGSVILDDKELYRINDRERAAVRNEFIGFIFQFYHLLPEFTALENVLLPAYVKYNNRSFKGLENNASAILKDVGLIQRRMHKPNQLSGGEQQRVAIARALINKPKIIFCDEPTGNLDTETGKGITDLLVELNKKNNQTFLIVTHDEEISKISHRTIFMRDGNLTNK